MKYSAAFVSFFLMISLAAFAKDDDKYDVSKINPALLKNANAVKRYELVRFEINDPGNGIYYYKRAITILNESGDEYAFWSQWYDKNTIIRSVDAILYDSKGKKIKSLKAKDIADVSGTSEGNLADDSRYKFHNFHCKSYPYTVEYEVEIKQHQLMFMPNWMAIEDDKFSVESSVFEIITPNDYTFRFKAFQYDKQPQITEGGKKTYHWEVSNLSAITDEYASPEWQKITPTIITGATDFELENHKGKMNSWVNFGKFVYNLKDKRDQLPDNIKAKVHELTDSEMDLHKKVGILYQYLQRNTRYVSIQLGIGGWQPFDATYVGTNKYGDCKALTNFMFSLLKEAGINSVYTLVKAGKNKRSIEEDFVSQQFNHVILAVPLAKDTVWLECTSQNLPAGYLSSFTANRYALMITEEGGKLVRTPSYKMKENLQKRNIRANLDENGKLTATVTTNYKAIQQDELFSFINTHTKKEQLESLKKMIDLPNYDITSFDYKISPSVLPELSESLNIVAENYAQVSGKRIFIQPNVLNKSSIQLKDEERHYDINLTYEFADADTVEIVMPAGFVAESMPQATSISNKFAIYKIGFKYTENKIMMTRLLEKKSGNFPKSDYKELAKFYSDIYKADRAKIVLIKKEE